MGLERKYVVFKADEFDEWFDHESNVVTTPIPDPLDDAVVIRKQDLFAASGLYAYGTAMLASTEIVEKLMEKLKEDENFNVGYECERLKVLAISFIEAAIDAETSEQKVPD